MRLSKTLEIRRKKLVTNSSDISTNNSRKSKLRSEIAKINSSRKRNLERKLFNKKISKKLN